MKNKLSVMKLFSRRLMATGETERLLLLSALFSVTMLLIRTAATGRAVFLFLPWNLFLACIPYLIVNTLIRHPQWIENKLRFVLVFLVWLLFIPNSFYILTDLYHLDVSRESPRWFDLTLIFSFAWNGLLLGILSVRRMETVMRVFLGHRTTLFFLYPLMWLIAWGIYIGRYMRFNSWDIITNPFALFSQVGEMFTEPMRYTYAWGMICCFSLFMLLVYLGIKNAGMYFQEKRTA